MNPFLTVTGLLLLAAFIVTVMSTTKPEPKAPLWVAVMFLIIIELLQVIPK